MHTMSAREYFAAHAPEAPDWFRYTEPNAPTAPPDGDLRDVDLRWARDIASGDISDSSFLAKEVGADRRAKILEYAKVYGDYLTQRTAHFTRKSMNKMVAWRYAYADAMVDGGINPDEAVGSLPGFTDPLVKLHVHDLGEALREALHAMTAAVVHLEECEAGKISHPFKSSSLPLLRAAIARTKVVL